MLPEVSKYLQRIKAAHDEDSVDRVNYVYTSSLLLIFSFLLSAKQYVGEPLQCWVPHQFKEGWERYVERHCFIENTYFTKIDEQLPDTSQERHKRELAYYQWLPVMLIIEAAFCYAPRVLWKLMNKDSGLDVTAFVSTSVITFKTGSTKKLKLGDDLFRPITEHFQKAIKAGKRKSIKFGKYVTILYLTVKMLFLTNVFIQFWLLDLFLGPEYTFWGIGIVLDMMQGRHWKESGHFPRVTFCDVKVREMGNLHNWTVQCVLMVNMFAEKIFIFLWFWFSFVGIITVLNLGYWVYVTFVPAQSLSFVKKYLTINGINVSENEIETFIDDALQMDGLTILRLISENSGDLAVADIVKNLWEGLRTHKASGSTSLVTSESDNGCTEDTKFLPSDNHKL